VSGLLSHNFAIAPNLTPADWLRDLRYLKTAYPLRSRWEYSNVNYVIASAIIEHIANSSFFDAVDDLLFEPLDVGATWNALEARSHQGGRSYGWPRRGRALELEDYIAEAEGADYESELCSTQEAFEFWTETEGSELVGAGSALMRGVDLVSPSSFGPITELLTHLILQLQWAKSLVNPSPTSSAQIFYPSLQRQRPKLSLVPV
jgi:CubicO group peptidase (beta-lactamase class C family)